VRYGYTASASADACGPRFLRITDIVPETINWDSVPFCEIDDADKKRFALDVGDIVVARTGATVGYAKLIREPIDAVLASYLVRFRVDPKIADPGFVGRMVESSVYKDFVKSRVGGAAQPNANAQVLGSFEFRLPTRHEQERIASILSAYDDLVENNRRRMALLEEAARQLYREWFVRLRFPGHEHTPITNGLPEGWERGTLGSIVAVQSGFAFKSSTYLELGKYGIVTIKNVHDGDFIMQVDSFLDDLPEKLPTHCQLATGDILLSLTGNIGRVCLVVGDYYLLNQRVAKLVPREDISRAFTYFTFRESAVQKRLEAISYGVAQQNLSPVKMCGIAFVLPPTRFIRQFANVAESVIDQLLVLKQQNEKLRAARDLLLPRLMSGEIAV
jgi:type I restriction enzyme, S subunit